MGGERVSERRAWPTGTGEIDTTTGARGTGGWAPMSGADGGAGDPIWTLWVPKGHGDVNRGRMEGESQTSGAVMEARRVEDAFKAAETKEAVAS